MALPAPTDAELCAAHPGVWAERKLGFDNAPFHWEWYDLGLTAPRLCIVAPREHAKSEVFTVNLTSWEAIYRPGTWTYVFAQTGDQASKLKDRIDLAILAADPWMVDRATVMQSKETVYANGSQVTVAGAGKGVRGAHPDRIVGDDVLSEENCLTDLQRKRIERWWFGTIGGMSHPGTTRTLPSGQRVDLAPTRICLVGTPFHQTDLLMGMRSNPLYAYRRYAAEFDPKVLVKGTWAVEVRSG